MPANFSSGGVATLISTEPRCESVDFSATALLLQLQDGRGISVPLEWLPRLKNASDEDRRNYHLVDGGEEIRWPALDEDLSVPALLGLPD